MHSVMHFISSVNTHYTNYFTPGGGAKYCNMYVCLSVHSYLKSNISKLHKIFCTCYLWPWLSPPLTTMQYIMLLLVLWMFVPTSRLVITCSSECTHPLPALWIVRIHSAHGRRVQKITARKYVEHNFLHATLSNNTCHMNTEANALH